MERGVDPSCRAHAAMEAKMVRLLVAALVAMGLSLGTPALAKHGCGKGYHMDKKGQCVIKRRQSTGNCGPGYHVGQNGHCQHD
jgi:hypothetical protein